MFLDKYPTIAFMRTIIVFISSFSSITRRLNSKLKLFEHFRLCFRYDYFFVAYIGVFIEIIWFVVKLELDRSVHDRKK